MNFLHTAIFYLFEKKLFLLFRFLFCFFLRFQFVGEFFVHQFPATTIFVEVFLAFVFVNFENGRYFTFHCFIIYCFLTSQS